MPRAGQSRAAASATDAVETEWQFEASDLEALRGSIGASAERVGLALEAEKPRNIRDLYLDTEDWRFYRAGYALRLRRLGNRTEATMKSLASLASGEDGPRRRREISEPVRVPRGARTSTPEMLAEALIGVLRRSTGLVGEKARALSGPREPRLLFEVRTRRQAFELIQTAPTEEEGSTAGVGAVVVEADGGIRSVDGAQTLGEVALDETEIPLGSGEGTVLLRRVEVEATDGQVEDAARFVEALRGTPGLTPVGASKFETGLEAAGLVPADVQELGPTGIDESMSASQVAFAVLRRHLGEALAHEPGVRIGEDPEELHDMRVAIRRLRSTLKLYTEYLPRKVERFEREFSHVGDVLGEVRDLDVQIERLSVEEGVSEVVVTALRDRRTQRREQMLAELDSDRYGRLVEDMIGTLRRGRAPTAPPILEVAPVILADGHKKVLKRAERVSGSSSFEELHDLRKKGRRMRYAVEPLAEVYGKPAEKMVGQLKELQDVLGDQQDKIVAAELLREVALSGDLPPEAVFSMGVEAERRRREAEEMHRGISKAKALRAVRKDDAWKRLRKVMRDRLPKKVKKG
jgi:CHAD domain-containing protein